MTQITKKRTIAQITKEEFLQGIWFNIVSRLSPKSVGHFTTVSKSLLNVPAFIATHLNRSIASNIDDDSLQYVFYVPFELDENKTCTKCIDNMVSFDKVYHVELPMDFKSIKCIIIGSCNGLVCLTDYACGFFGRAIYVFNPLLWKFKCIAVVRRFMTKNNLKLKSKINDAKVSGIIERSYQPVFVDGTLNWLAGYSRKSGVMIESILSFDCCSEVFREVELPGAPSMSIGS
ncbi:putative F-box protein [Abeliophyllum distichum]|uniref:F-box protein n=1 Tax=Abeliophyllum distichum TaxID=126358 RepID=A0ABD1RPR4_9LAMI